MSDIKYAQLVVSVKAVRFEVTIGRRYAQLVVSVKAVRFEVTIGRREALEEYVAYFKMRSYTIFCSRTLSNLVYKQYQHHEAFCIFSVPTKRRLLT
jgi:hypothetical protein